jgi:disulfide bond formation protein DsbB
MSKLSFRVLFGLGCAGCISAVAFALILQTVGHFEPCPMCIFQRIAFLFCALFFAIGAIHGPRAAGRWVYVALVTLCALVGAGIAGRQTWLQSLPADQVPECGPTLDYLLKMLPVTQVVTLVLKGDGSCAKIDAVFLGITLPGWTLIVFALLIAYTVASPLFARRAPAASGFREPL